MIIGGRVTEGGLCLCNIVIIMREDKPLGTMKAKRLECSKEQVEKVKDGQECGVSLEGNVVVEEGDVLEFYTEEEK